jgi:hypothetical protein
VVGREVGASDLLHPPCLQGTPPAAMRLFLSLPVLVVALCMALEGKSGIGGLGGGEGDLKFGSLSWSRAWSPGIDREL